MSRMRAIAALAATAVIATSAHAQVKIGVVTSATGPTSFVGVPQKNSVALLPKRVGDTTIEYFYLDDASDSTQSVTNVKKLIAEQKIDALIGPSGSPNAMGVIGFIAEAKTPMLAPTGSPAVVLPMDDKKRWVFKTTQNDDIIADALIEHMTKTGVKTLGFIGYNDPYGESWYKTIVPMLQKAGIQLVANERYNRLDTSVTGQVLRLKAAAPDAVLVAGVAAAAALPQMQLVDAGYAGQGLPDPRRGNRRFHPDRRQEGRGRDHGGRPPSRAGPGARQRPVEAAGGRVRGGLREALRDEAGDLRRERL